MCAAEGASTGDQVYIGVCLRTDYTSYANFGSEVTANGVPPRCIAWGMGQDFITVNNGQTRESHQLQPEGFSYTPDATVCIRVSGGLVEFYVQLKGTQSLVASVMVTDDATLRPFVAVRGQRYECTIVKASIASTGKPCIGVYMYVCICIYIYIYIYIYMRGQRYQCTIVKANISSTGKPCIGVLSARVWCISMESSLEGQ